MAIRNNTTSLGMGGGPRITARQFNDYTAASISTAVAKANYKKSIRSDYRVAELRQYVFKMVSSWSEQDKQAILAEYGDSKMLRSGKLNEAVTETLIIRLKEEDLLILLKDIKSDELKLGKKVQKIRGSQKRMASKFGASSFEDLYSTTRNIKNTKNIQKTLKAYDKSFKIPKNVRNMFGSLKKELREIIPVMYDRVEVTGLAVRMNIDFSEGVKYKELINMIINKTLLYVAIISGKTKALFAGAIVDPAPFKELLARTSTPWLSGSSGLNKSETKSLKQEMLLAKARSNEMSRQKKRTMGIGKRGLLENALYQASKPLALPGALIEKLGGGGLKNPLNLLGAGAGGLGGGIAGGLT
jgi:hypothetical protein